jgi:hypothetical protein
MVFQAELSSSRHVQLRIKMAAIKTETFIFSQSGSYQINYHANCKVTWDAVNQETN